MAYEGQFETDDDTQYGRNCRIGDGTPRGYITYVNNSAQASIGEVRGVVTVTSTFGDASWDVTLAPETGGGYQTVKAYTFSQGDSYNYPFCGHDFIVGAVGGLNFRPGGELANLDLYVYPDTLAPGEVAWVSASGRDSQGRSVPFDGPTDLTLDLGEGTVGYLRWNGQQGLTLSGVDTYAMETGQVEVVAEELPLARQRGAHRAGGRGRAARTSPGPDPVLRGPATLTVTATLVDYPGVSGTITVDVVQEGPVLTVTAVPETIRPDERAQIVLDAVGPDGQPVEIEGSTVVTVTAEPAEALAWGRLALIAGAQDLPVPDGRVQWNDLAYLHFVADGERPDETQTLTISAEIEGEPGTRRSGALVLEVPPMEVRLLSQNDEPLTDGYVMVSNVPTEWALLNDDPDPLPFDAAGDGPVEYGTYDPDTYRPEVTIVGLMPDAEVRFCVETLSRDGVQAEWHRAGCGDDRTENRFVGVPGPDGSGTFRSALHVRLVADEVDDGRGFDHEDRQTYRVWLRDEVRVTAEVLDEQTNEWNPVGEPLAFKVGAPAVDPVAGQPNSSVDAVRRVDLAWQAEAGASVSADDAAETTARITQQYAQAAIYAEQAGAFETFRANETMTNVLELRLIGDETRGGGTVEIRMAGQTQPVRLAYEGGREIHEVMDRFRQQLEADPVVQSLGGRTAIYAAETETERTFELKPETEADLFFLVIGAGTEARITGFPRESDALELKREPFPDFAWYSHELFALAQHVKDFDGGTADVIVLQDGAFYNDPSPMRPGPPRPDPSIGGKGLDNRGEERFFASGTAYTLFLTTRSVDGSRDYWATAGHELGHVLGLGHYCDGDLLCTSDAFDDDRTNLMYARPETLGENMGGPKRLTPNQQLQIRGLSRVLLHATDPDGNRVAGRPPVGSPPSRVSR